MSATVKQEPGKTCVYKDEVLGNRVEILFQDENGANHEFYAGTIRKVKMELAADASLAVEHFIEFDDGDAQWFDLGKEEKEGRLLWRKPTVGFVAAALPSSEVIEDVVVTPPPNKKQKSDDETETASDEEFSNTSSEEEEEEVEDEEQQEVNEPDTTEDSPSEEIAEAASIGDTAGPFKALDEKTKQWISAIGLEDGYDTGDEGLSKIETLISEYMAPPEFETVFLLADFLFPVEEGEETYHLRLFKSDSRKGIKIRKQLRDIKKKTPDDELVCWHQRGKHWIPPNGNVLAGMVRLIVDYQ